MGANVALGIDIGGSGIKGAPVDLRTGKMTGERLRIETPARSTPKAVAKVVRQIARNFADELPPDSPIGVTIPTVVQHGVVKTAANIDDEWIDAPGQQIIAEAVGRPISLVNDADAAGLAEVRYGAAKGRDGLILVVTLGTGVGVAIVHDGVLIPNAELGHIELDGVDAETRVSAAAREREGLSYPQWAARLQRYFSQVEFLLWPDLFIVGGGVSRKADRFLPLLKLRTPIVPAELRNGAGIAGAALFAAAERNR
ncbi:polyphosphate--glucose phosphotransferase [Propionicicella superfundia]|uniref:polyphosphate--glucose phosphotransferase n=1 Tax=Propionicicella superfundia TaxID=348582 RepID=UPI000401DDA0|nr:ROK family protein [Propionicicella superfundia]